MSVNYDDVLRQLRDHGLLIDRLIIGPRQSTGLPWRCKVEGGGNEKRGWYLLHEITLRNGDVAIVGSFGVYHGNDPGTRKVELKHVELDPAQKAALRQRLADDKRKAEAARAAVAARAARHAQAAWLKCSPTGEHDYLTRKLIDPCGARFSPKGALVVPMHDAQLRIHGLQFILSRQHHAQRIQRTGRDKEFWPAGLTKKGHFFPIGPVGSGPTLVAEGFATAASLHKATGLPVVVAFDAGNILPVVSALAKRHRDAKWLICADDDCFTEGNPGVTAAQNAALAVGGEWIAPVFTDDPARHAAHAANGRKITDFNDLHVLEGPTPVQSQIQAKLDALGWLTQAPAPRAGHQGGAGEALRPIQSFEETIERFALIFGHGGTVFDHQEHTLLALTDMKDACTHRDYARRWQESTERKIYRLAEVGFDPSGADPAIKANLWAGWPTTPKEGPCDRILELLQYMCGNDSDPAALYHWVLCWLAYPIQHPGAKMKTCLVIHGPQGTGKNLFFEAYMAIFGHYATVIDQSSIEDKHNDWASRKLFLIADEVVARSDLYHIKNKLKAFITGDVIRINPKHIRAYDERNHVNLVFLSNEPLPAVIEPDDRRHTVIWTPEKLSPGFYKEVGAEIASGGIAALHHHLLHLDLGDFTPHAKPPMTDAKAELIELSKDSIVRFLDTWAARDLEDIPLVPALSEDVFTLYRHHCLRYGLAKSASLPTMLGTLGRRPGVRKDRKRYVNGTRLSQGTFVFPPGCEEIPPGAAESAWLAEKSVQFRTAVDIYREKFSAHAR